MNAIVGYTGFVGSNLYTPERFRAAYNTKNIETAFGTGPDLLVYAGVRAENIEMSNLCTACNADLLFSHRASKGRRGNLGAFLMIRETPSQYMSG